MADLRQQGIVTKVRSLKTGERVGGVPFTRGPLAYLLRNRFYIGEVAFKGEILRGEQPPIIDRALFDAVQAKLNEQATNHKTSRMQSEAVLAGRIFDDRGNRMSPTHARKGGVKYRYYLSSALLQGTAERAGSVRRAPAAQIEALVAKSVRERLALSEPMDDRAIIERHVARVEVQRERLIVDLLERMQSIANALSRFLGRRRRENGAVRFLCRRECHLSTRVRSAPKLAPCWSRRLPADAVGSRKAVWGRRRPRKRRENAHAISGQRRLLLDPRAWPGLSLPNLRATVGIVRLLWASAPCWVAWKAGTRVAYKSASVRFSTVESGSAAANAPI